jgi:hypothetical protein
MDQNIMDEKKKSKSAVRKSYVCRYADQKGRKLTESG